MATTPPTNVHELRSFERVRVLVMGLGRFGGGVGVTRWLAGQGARVTVTDQAGPRDLAASVEALGDLGLALRLDGHDPRDLDACDLVLVNPAVDKARSGFFQEIRRRALPWTTELNLFCERCPATVVGVTGTYGKSTTCAMLAAALRACQGTGSQVARKVYLGGNIGRSLLGDLDGMSADDLVVLEMSNAQLEDLPRIDWAPDIAVITNLRPHHLDRYGAYEAYVAAKLNIVRASDYASRVVVGDVDERARVILGRVVPDGAPRICRVARPDPPVSLRVPGQHNQANAACALAVCGLLEVDEGIALEALASFAGLPHRLEHIRTLDGVDYVNDSKSTSPDAAVASMKAVDRPILAIVGGQAKEVSLDNWAEHTARACRLVICIDESGPAFARALRATGGSGNRCIVQETSSLGQAISTARAQAEAGDVVLFAPGAPSFDRYPNFASRGLRFRDLVNAL